MIPLKINTNESINHYLRIEGFIKSQINKVINKRIKINKKFYTANVTETILLRKLKNDNFLRRLITSEASDLPKIIKLFNNFDSKVTETDNRLNRILYSIFVKHGYDKMDNDLFINNISLDTCPYCNRNYIYNVSNKSRVKPEIDHFYPKGKYPFLGASFYNMIPSCQNCNGAKGNKDPFTYKMKSPYLIDNNDFKFTFILNSLDFKSPLRGDSAISVKLKKPIFDDDKNDVFRLRDLYEKHEDHVLELIIKSKLNYNKAYRNYLNSYDGLEFSDEEINRLFTGNYTEINELHKRPLAKLYRDISLDLGLIKL